MYGDIELYMDKGKFCAYIGMEDCSGEKLVADTKEECIRLIAEYFEDYGEWEQEEDKEE